jgi:hypothetical protein
MGVMKPSVLIPPAIVATLAVLVSCGSPKRYDVVTPRGELHTLMWQIQSGLDKLDGIMADKPDQAEVLKVLGKIEAAARRIATSKIKAKHPMLKSNAPTFHRMVKEAYAAAAATPPNYYKSGKLGGTCGYCHDPGGGLRTQ